MELANLSSGYSGTIVKPGKPRLAGIYLRFLTILKRWGIDLKERQ
jgi:hypothetical protein